MKRIVLIIRWSRNKKSIDLNYLNLYFFKVQSFVIYNNIIK